jgi:hypothetical protein
VTNEAFIWLAELDLADRRHHPEQRTCVVQQFFPATLDSSPLIELSNSCSLRSNTHPTKPHAKPNLFKYVIKICFDNFDLFGSLL